PLFIIVFSLISFLSIGYGAFSQTLNILANANIISEGDFIYTYLPYNQSINITAYNGVATNVIVPSTLNNYPVKIIDKSSFMGKDLTNVVIPEGVETIHYGAFMNNKLKQLIIPASISSLGNEVFENNDLEIVSFKGDIPPTFGHNVFELNYHLLNVCIPSTADELVWKNALGNAGVNTNPNMLINPTANLIKGRSGACAEIGTGDITGPPALQCGENAYQVDNACLCFDQYEGNPYVMCSLKLELTCFEFAYQGWSKYNVLKTYKCTKSSIIIPDLVDGIHTGKINKDTFASKGLTKVTLNNYLKIIDMYSFRFNNLRTITFLENVESILLNAFTGNNLETIVFKGKTPPKMNTNCFTENPNLKKICVPIGKTAAYTTALNGSGLPSDAVIYENQGECKIN
ncbi:MAG: leucine-rich repeat protein, partial [Bacilli bacterium]